jgi:hypothetical protein
VAYGLTKTKKNVGRVKQKPRGLSTRFERANEEGGISLQRNNIRFSILSYQRVIHRG